MIPKKLIENIDFFKNLNSKQIDVALKNLELRDYKKNQTIFKENSPKDSGVFFIVNGIVNILKPSSSEVLIGIPEGDHFKLLSVFYDNDEKRDYTAVANVDVKVAFLAKNLILRMCAEDKSFKKIIYDESSKRHDLFKLFKIFTNLYGNKIDHKGFQEIISAGDFIHLPDNTNLFELGEQSDSIFFLVSGLLKAFVPSNGSLIPVGEIYEGEVIGEMGILSDEPRSASVYSTRRSLVFKLSKSNTNMLMMKHPEIILQFANKIADRLRVTQTPTEDSSLRTDIFSILTASLGEGQKRASINIGKTLSNAISSISSCYYLSKEVVNKILNINDINKELASRENFGPLEDLLIRLCSEYRYLILLCDVDYTRWTSWCMSVSETDIYLVNPIVGINNQKLLDAVESEEKKVPSYLNDEKQIMIYHKSKNVIPKDTFKYFEEISPVLKHFHIALDDSKDIDRVARTLIGKSIGLCLSGGGAKGNAHIGVYKALIENGIPIDTVCGTSAGGIIASLIASGHSPDKIIELLKISYSNNVFKEYTLPYSSIIATNKVIEDAKVLSKNRYIEDLWLPLFTCAVNISTSELAVLDRGPIWEATRATAALPGILLPVIKGKSLLVDGGLINNMPGDILLDRFGGKLISVSVSPEEDMVANFDRFPHQASHLLKKLLFKTKKSDLDVPNIGDILMRSIMVSSAAKSLEVEKISDIFLNPKVDNVGMLEFESIDESVEIGYNYTMKKLEKIDLNKLYK